MDLSTIVDGLTKVSDFAGAVSDLTSALSFFTGSAGDLAGA